MTFSIGVHVIAGSIALLAGYTALFSRKGARRHRASGAVFVYAMVVMALTGAAMAALNGVRTDALIGLLTTYLVVTGLTTLTSPGARRRWLDVGAMALGLAVGLSLLTIGLRGGDAASEMPIPMFFVFGSIAVAAGLSDIRVMRASTGPRTRRLFRHLWRMCFALLIAAASFFLGQAQVFPEAIRLPALLGAPVLLVMILMVYWMWRVRHLPAAQRSSHRAENSLTSGRPPLQVALHNPGLHVEPDATSYLNS